ncbi:MAG: helix-turn-helix domain-containing protein [Vallitalea sp.]|nr:helix-turn-helix domain-containing protein [Vallitalea sp.]
MKIHSKELRLKMDISIRDLEKKSKVPRSTLSNIENNHVDPKVSTLCKIAKALNCKLDDIVSY